MRAANDNTVQGQDLPDTFTINGETFNPGDTRRFIEKNYPEPRGGFFIHAKGGDGRRYYIAARVEPKSDDDDEDERIKWNVEFYRTQKHAARALKPGWKALEKQSYYWDEEDEFEEAA
jgi:hypothetical protein